jgi:hypothetical protein
MSMMAELSHLEEIITQLDKHTADPFSLPSSTEQVKKLNLKYPRVSHILFGRHPSDDFRVEGHDRPQSLGSTDAAQQSQFTGVTQVFHVQFGFDPQLVERKRRFSFSSNGNGNKKLKNFFKKN